jgi:hypothetical protein
MTLSEIVDNIWYLVDKDWWRIYFLDFFIISVAEVEADKDENLIIVNIKVNIKL